MAIKVISIPDDLKIKLDRENNASGLIQNLLYEHYKDPQENKTEAQIIKEVKTKIEEKKEEETRKEQLNSIEEYWKNITEAQLEEYREGLRMGKWKSSTEYATFKLNKLEHAKESTNT